MDAKELELERKTNIEYLNAILDAYRSADRKSKKIFVFIIVVCAIAVYFVFSALLGSIWGYVSTIAILGIGAYCVSTLGISFKNDVVPDGKLAHQACITMEILIAIKNGTYRQYGAHILTSGSGKHLDLYKRFVQLYPEYTCKELKRLAKIQVEQKDMFG